MIDLTQFWKDNPKYANCPRKEYAIFGIQYIPLAANAVSQDGNFSTGTDADFIITSMYGSQSTSVTNAAYIQTPLISNIVYTTKSRNITSIPVEWTTIIGTALNPRIYFPYPIVVPKATQVDVYLSNPTGNPAANAWIAFHGIKVFL